MFGSAVVKGSARKIWGDGGERDVVFHASGVLPIERCLVPLTFGMGERISSCLRSSCLGFLEDVSSMEGSDIQSFVGCWRCFCLWQAGASLKKTTVLTIRWKTSSAQEHITRSRNPSCECCKMFDQNLRMRTATIIRFLHETNLLGGLSQTIVDEERLMKNLESISQDWIMTLFALMSELMKWRRHKGRKQRVNGTSMQTWEWLKAKMTPWRNARMTKLQLHNATESKRLPFTTEQYGIDFG